MPAIRQIFGLIQIAFFTIASWTAGEAMVYAQAGAKPSAPGGGAWVWAYMIVLLLVSLGMIAVCKSSGRRDRAKPEVFEGKKTTLKD